MMKQKKIFPKYPHVNFLLGVEDDFEQFLLNIWFNHAFLKYI